MKKTKLFAAILAVVMMSTLIIGCVPAKTTQDGKPGTSTESPAPGKTIRTDIVFGESSDITSLDPQDQTDVYSAALCHMVYERLVEYDNDVNLIPGLAESWDILSDVEYKLNIRKGVKFHNGDELTSADVAFTLDRLRTMSKTKALYDCIVEIKEVDPYTVTFKTNVPTAPIMLNLAGPQAHVVNKKVVQEAESKGIKYGIGEVKPVGTGPMVYGEWKANDFYKLNRFDGYWKGAVKATSITCRVIPENSSRTIALEKGEVDFLGTVPPIDVERVKTHENLQYQQIDGTSLSYMGMNVAHPVLKDVKIRQAISHAIDKANIIEVNLEGLGKPVNSPFQTMMPGHDPDLDRYPYDPAKAKELLAESSYKPGTVLEVGISGSSDRMAQLIQADLAKIGITAQVNLYEFGSFLEFLGSAEKKHAMFILGWSNCYNPDRTASIMFHSKNGGVAGNRTWYANPEVDKLIDDARTELDWSKREPMYKEIQRIVTEDATWVPLYQTINTVGAVKGYKGFVVSTLNSFHSHINGWIEE